MTSSKPDYFPKDPSLNIITLGNRASALYEFEGTQTFSSQHIPSFVILCMYTVPVHFKLYREYNMPPCFSKCGLQTLGGP